MLPKLFSLKPRANGLLTNTPMSNLFSELEKAREEQRAVLAQPPSEQAPENEDTQKSTQVSKRISKPLSKTMSKIPTTDDIETLAFRLRKIPKSRVNADIPADWKERLDDLAFRLRVGKYDLMLYVIAYFLGEIGKSQAE